MNLLVGTLLVVTVCNPAVTLFGQGQAGQRQNAERVQELKRKFPVADYHAPEPPDDEKKAKRLKRSQRHDGSMMGVKGGLSAPPGSGEEHVLIDDWEVRVPKLPAGQSDVVLVGKT